MSKFDISQAVAKAEEIARQEREHPKPQKKQKRSVGRPELRNDDMPIDAIYTDKKPPAVTTPKRVKQSQSVPTTLKPKPEKKKTNNMKMCVRCKKTIPVGMFYTHRDWEEQRGRDAWCKSCVAAHAVNKQGLQEYCYYNNRLFSDEAYANAMTRAPYDMATNPVFTNEKSTQKDKDEEMAKVIVRGYLSIMNLRAFYKYFPNISADNAGNVRPLPESTEVAVPDEMMGSQVVYSEKWWGHYTKRELKYLEDYYAQLATDFPMDTGSVRDYAVKIAKQSLIVNELQERFKKGEVKIGEVQDAIRIFDTLNQSSNFSESRRKASDTGGLGSFGELVYKIEQSGKLENRLSNFPPDDVDMLRNDMRHTFVALGEE